MKCIRIRYLPTGKGQRKQLQSLSSFLDKHCICVHRCYFLVICLLSQTRYIFAHAQMRYNLPCGRLRYDINPLHAPQGISHRRYIARDSVYRKSRKGFISLRSVLKGTTLRGRPLFAVVRIPRRPCAAILLGTSLPPIRFGCLVFDRRKIYRHEKKFVKIQKICLFFATQQSKRNKNPV